MSQWPGVVGAGEGVGVERHGGGGSRCCFCGRRPGSHCEGPARLLGYRLGQLVVGPCGVSVRPPGCLLSGHPSHRGAELGEFGPGFHLRRRRGVGELRHGRTRESDELGIGVDTAEGVVDEVVGHLLPLVSGEFRRFVHELQPSVAGPRLATARGTARHRVRISTSGASACAAAASGTESSRSRISLMTAGVIPGQHNVRTRSSLLVAPMS